MTNTQAGPDRSSNSARHPRPRAVTRSVAVPKTRSELNELRDLLETNLQALKALHLEHRVMLELSLRTIDPSCSELRSGLGAMGNSHAPWVQALSEPRALLFVALRELIVGTDGAGLSMPLPQHEPADPHHRLR